MLFKDLHNNLHKLLRDRVPFAVYAIPGESDYTIVNGSGEKSIAEDLNHFQGFAVSEFGIGKPLWSIGECESKDNRFSGDTDYKKYLSGIESVVNSFDVLTEKTVISRIKTVEAYSNPISVAATYFQYHTDCFRFLYYHPAMGLWLGATPELLFSYNYNYCVLQTMALAGTRQTTAHCGWDKKNTEEHNLVVKHITETLFRLGMTPHIEDSSNVRFAKISHLCHRISAECRTDLNSVFNALNPTPAVCGFPIDKALSQISEVEDHNRSCYSGAIAVGDGKIVNIYVNLRCAYISMYQNGKYGYTLFAGGGINKMSTPEREWEETEFKMESLLKAIYINNRNQSNYYEER